MDWKTGFGRPSLRYTILYWTGLDWTGRISGGISGISGRSGGREWEETLRRTDSQPTPNPVWANLRSFAHSGWRE